MHLFAPWILFYEQTTVGISDALIREVGFTVLRCINILQVHNSNCYVPYDINNRRHAIFRMASLSLMTLF